jgi:hypothetical protein
MSLGLIDLVSLTVYLALHLGHQKVGEMVHPCLEVLQCATCPTRPEEQSFRAKSR